MEKEKRKRRNPMNIFRPTYIIVPIIFLLIISYPSTKGSLAGVDPLSGNFNIDQVDFTLRFHSIQIDISRSFNSVTLDHTRGGRWSFHPFEKRLFLDEKDKLLLKEGENLIVFGKVGGDVFLSRDRENISFSKNEFIRVMKNGNLEVYDREGKLLRIVYADGKTLSLVYNKNKIERIVSGGKELLKYFYNKQGLISMIRAHYGISSSYQYNQRGLLTDAINEDSLVTHYEYDEKDRLTYIKFQTGDFIRLAYHGDTGMVKSITKVDGIVQYAYERDPKGFISKVAITHPTGIERISLENNGKTIKHTDIMGNVTESHYEDGLLTRYVDAKGYRVEYGYDFSGRLAEIKNPDGGKVTLSYLDDTLLIKRQTLPDGSTVEFFYNNKKQLVKRQGPGNFEVSYSYNDMGLVDSLSYGRGEKKFWKKYIYDSYEGIGLLLEETDSLNRAIKYKYDSRGRMTHVVDPLGRTLIFKYNDFGFLTEISDSTGIIFSSKYDKNLRLVEVLDKLGLSTKFSYDNKGNLEIIEFPKGTRETYGYDSNGLLKSVLDSKGNRQSYEYNKLGLVTKEVGPQGATSIYHYDGFGNIVGVQEPYGLETKREYDIMGRAKAAIRPGGIRHDYTYDKLGNIIAEKDGFGNIKKYVYDASGNLRKVVLPNGEETLYEYDSEGFGNPVSAKTPDGRKYFYQYDIAGRMIQGKTPWGEVIGYSYDKIDNLVKKTSSGGKGVDYQYDGEGRLRKLVTSEGLTETYDYDRKGYVVKVVGKGFEKTLSYNPFGELIEEEYPLLGKKLRYTYDKWSNRTGLEIPGHLKIAYEYDSLNRLTTIEYQKGKKIQISYDGLNRKTEVSYPNGTKIKYSYHPSNYLESTVYYDRADRIITKHQYIYDKAGRLSRLTNLKGQTKEFTYDSNGQLIQASLDGEKTYFEYDAAFRRLAETRGNKKRNFRYNEPGQLTETDNIRITYDSSGNISSKKVDGIETKYHFDSLGRLTHVKAASGNIEYHYSPEGQRVGKKVGDEKSYYLYDGLNLLMELDQEKNPTKIFIHAGDEIDSPMVMLKGSDSWFYFTDYLGSVIGLADEKGEITTSYNYEPFGLLKSKGKETGNPLTYTGRYYDREIGLYYYRARYYDPELGIFVSPDPHPKSLENPKDFNEYVFVRNDPINLVDPLGLDVSEFFRGKGAKPPFFLDPAILPGENVNSPEFWDRMARDYQFLKDNFGPGTAGKFRDKLNQHLISRLPKPAVEKPGILESAYAKTKDAFYRLRSYVSPPKPTTVLQSPSPSPPINATRIGKIPTTSSPSGGPSPGSPTPGGPTPGTSSGWTSFFKKDVGWGGGIMGVLTGVFVGYNVGSRYAEYAKQEGRRLTGKEYAMCAGESALRAVISVLTSGVSEVAIYALFRHKELKPPILTYTASAVSPSADQRKPEEALVRFKGDLNKMKEEIERTLKGPIQQHKAACEALDRMIKEAEKYASEAKEIEYRIPTRDTIQRWEEVANRCKKAEDEKGSDEKLEKLRNEAQKNGRDVISEFKRAENLAWSCRDPEDSSEIWSACKSCEDNFIKIKYRADEAKRLGREVTEFETEVRNTKSDLNAALKDRDKLIALKKKIPSRKAWEEQVKKAESTKEALLKKAKDLDNEVKTLMMNYESKMKSEEEYKFYELRKPLITIETQICDIEAKRKMFNDSFEKVENIDVTAANRLRTGLKLNDGLSECLKVGWMNLLADIEKVQKEAEKIMAGIPKLQEAANRCYNIRYVLCYGVDLKGAPPGETLGQLKVSGKRHLERNKIRHVVLGGPYESEEKAELAWLRIAQGGKPVEYPVWAGQEALGGQHYINAGGMKCLFSLKDVQDLQKQKPPTVASLPKERVDDLKPKENEWFVYVNVVDASGKGISSASVYSHDIGGYQAKNLGGGRFRIGPFWKRSPTDKRSIEIRAEVMFRSPQSFAYMPRYKNVPVLLADQSTVEVTIQFTDQGDFMREEIPTSVKESSVETDRSFRPSPAPTRESSVGTGEAGEIPPFLLDSKTKGKLTGRATGGATTPPPPTVRPEERRPETSTQPPTTVKRSRMDCIYQFCPMCEGAILVGAPAQGSDCDRCIKANQANIDRCVNQ
jgi:RHS repeat-associated protein